MDNKHLNNEIDDLADDPVDRLLQEKPPASSGKPIAILALLVALSSVSAAAWHWWQTRSGSLEDTVVSETVTQLQLEQQQLNQAVTALKRQLESAEKPVDADEFSRQIDRLESLESQLNALKGQSSEYLATISALQGGIRSLEQRLSATESSLVSVAASSQNSSVELNVAEIDFLLRTASERLSLFSDPVAADLALLAADVQLEALDDPMFLSVRQRIANARQLLASLPVVDRVELTSKLSELQSAISTLPFRGEEEIVRNVELADDAGWWESFKHTMSSLVTVRRKAPDDTGLLSLEDKDYLRQGLWLQLESARLALMRNDADGWSRSLLRVTDTLDQFFLRESPSVKVYAADARALQQVEVAPGMPDISAPWMQLRQLRDSRRLLQSSRPLQAEPAAEEAKPEPEPAPVEEGQPENGDKGQ